MENQKEKIEILIDDREPKNLYNYANFWIKNKNFSHFTIKKERIDTSDILCKKSNIGIELKRYNTLDAKESLVDGRFPNQIIKMKKSNIKNRVYIFIGKIDYMFDLIKKYSYRSMNQLIMSYYGAIASIQTKYNCNINVVPNDKHAILLAFFIIKHSLLKPREDMIIQTPTNLITEKSRKIASLCCLEGVGEVSAKKILEKYNYSINIIKNIKDIEKLKKETRIRKNSAKNIINYFNK